MEAFSNINKIKAFLAPKMTDLIKLPENNGKPTIYTGGKITDSIVI